MANITITDLPALSTMTDSDVIPVVNVGANVTQKITGTNLKTYFTSNIASLTVTGNIIGGNIDTTGNITGTYIYGDTTEANILVAGTANISGNVVANNFVGSGTNVDIVAGLYDWIFDNSGNLTLPGNTFAVNYANGTAVSLGGNYGNTNVATFLASFGSNNISTTGNVTANNFIGNISLIGNIQGTSANVELVAGSYTWTFDNTGTLTLPAVGGNEGAELQLTQAANSTLSGNTVSIDQYVDQIRFFEGGGNTRGAYIDLSQAAAGVGSLLNNRVSSFVDAGTFVTMDNIKATVTASSNRGLSLATTTGSITYNIGGTYGGVGGTGGLSVNAQTLTTTPTASIFGWNFGAEGEVSTYVLVDKTNNRSYRITLSIGPAYLSNMISIERLV